MLTRTDYIEKFKDAAVKATIGTPLFPSVMLAQAIIESNNGNSLLASKYNNHFGVKAYGGWKGKVIKLATGEVYSGKAVTITDGFRVYANALASFKDRNQFLLDNGRYEKAGVFAAKTAQEQAKALQKAGYATDPLYAEKIIRVITVNRLQELDEQKKNELV